MSRESQFLSKMRRYIEESVMRAVESLMRIFMGADNVLSVPDAAMALSRSDTWLRRYKNAGMYFQQDRVRKTLVLDWETARHYFDVKWVGSQWSGDVQGLRQWVTDNDPAAKLNLKAA